MIAKICRCPATILSACSTRLSVRFVLQDEMKQLAKSERLAVHLSNAVNLVLFAAKVYASIESKSLAVIASTLDSLLDLLSGFILWFTSHAMKNPNQYHYPIGKKRMQPVVRHDWICEVIESKRKLLSISNCSVEVVSKCSQRGQTTMIYNFIFKYHCMVNIYTYWSGLLIQGIIVFASVMATLGLQILIESARQLVAKVFEFKDEIICCWSS